MGTKLKFETDKENRYKQAIYDVCDILLYRLTHPWCVEDAGNVAFNPRFLQERRKTKILHQFTKEVIQEREKNFSDIELPKEEHDVYKGKKRLAMLDLLLSVKRNEGSIDDEGIQEEVDTFMFEGHDTTSMALGFTLMLLANNKNAQVRTHPFLNVVIVVNPRKPSYKK